VGFSLLVWFRPTGLARGGGREKGTNTVFEALWGRGGTARVERQICVAVCRLGKRVCRV